jgi:uncharacterized protein
VIVDTHIHVWPDKIAKRALANPLDDMERFGDGTVASAIESMRAAGVDRSVALGVADTPERVDAANRFVASLDPDWFVGFGTVHPGLPVEDNVASLRAHGLRGVKLHPLFQGYALDDPGLMEILDALQGEFVVLAHVGNGDSPEANRRATPAMARDIALRFPRLDLICAHLGGYQVLDAAEEQILGLPVHVDTSWPPGLASVDPARVRRFVERHGPERVLFATDWPMADPAREIAAIEALGLSGDDTAAILGGNMSRLLGLS